MDEYKRILLCRRNEIHKREFRPASVDVSMGYLGQKWGAWERGRPEEGDEEMAGGDGASRGREGDDRSVGRKGTAQGSSWVWVLVLLNLVLGIGMVVLRVHENFSLMIGSSLRISGDMALVRGDCHVWPLVITLINTFQLCV